MIKKSTLYASIAIVGMISLVTRASTDPIEETLKATLGSIPNTMCYYPTPTPEGIVVKRIPGSGQVFTEEFKSGALSAAANQVREKMEFYKKATGFATSTYSQNGSDFLLFKPIYQTNSNNN